MTKKDLIDRYEEISEEIPIGDKEAEEVLADANVDADAAYSRLLDKMKLSTPEEIEAALKLPAASRQHETVASRRYRMAATAKAACERLAKVERCGTCGGDKQMRLYIGSGKFQAMECDGCDGTGDAFKTWQDACRSLGAGAGREG